MEDVPEWWREHTEADAKQVPPLRSHLDHISQFHITTLTLAGLNIGDEEVKVLTACEPLCASLTSLDLANNQIKHEGVSIASNMRCLRKLDLSKNGLSNTGAEALADCPSLTELDVSSNICVIGLRAIASSTSITRLRMNGVAREYAELDMKIARAISNNTTVTSLSMARCSMYNDAVELIARNKSITHLDLGRNHLGPRGARALAVNTWLRHLDVKGCSIGTEGAIDLLTNCHLTSLDLSCIPLAKASIPLGLNTMLRCLSVAGSGIESALATLLGRNTNLTRLKLSQSIDMKAARSLATNSTLKRLSLTSCPLTDEIAKVMALNSTLTRLSIKRVKLGKEGALALAKMRSVTRLCIQPPINHALNLTLALPALATNRTLKSLDITSTTRAMSDGLIALAMNSTLTSLRVNYTSLNDEELAALTRNTTLRHLAVAGSLFSDDQGWLPLLHSSTLTSLDLTDIRPSVPALHVLEYATNLRHLNLNTLPTQGDELSIARKVASHTNLAWLRLTDANIYEDQYPSWKLPLALYLARNGRLANEQDALRKANMIGKVTGVFDAPTLVDLGIAAVMRHDWPLSELAACLPSELASRFQRHDDFSTDANG